MRQFFVARILWLLAEFDDQISQLAHLPTVEIEFNDGGHNKSSPFGYLPLGGFDFELITSLDDKAYGAVGKHGVGIGLAYRLDWQINDFVGGDIKRPADG